MLMNTNIVAHCVADRRSTYEIILIKDSLEQKRNIKTILHYIQYFTNNHLQTLMLGTSATNKTATLNDFM